MSFSHVVVGAGSSGCVIASRLSERGANNVLLIEAGPDTPPGEEPETILDSYSDSANLDARSVWPERQVKDTSGLRVADASAFPAIPSANTNLPTIILAEKIADHILGAT